MISPNLRTAFNELDINDKRDKISSELMFIGELLKKIETQYDIIPDFQIKNYDVNSNLTEDETLYFIYDDIFEIQKQLMLIITNINSNKEEV